MNLFLIFWLSLWLFTACSSSRFSWAQKNLGVDPENWQSIAMSIDGTKLATCVYNGYIYTSTDGGETWTKSYSERKIWMSITMSADGTKLAAGASLGLGYFFPYIYTSNDGGVTWREQTKAGDGYGFGIFGINMSSDGTKLVACVYDGYIYTSTDGGTHWTKQDSAGSRKWRDVKISGDCNKIAAVAEEEQFIFIGTR